MILVFMVNINEQQENIGQIINEVNRLREELAKLKIALRQGFILIDETCAKHSSALEGLQSLQAQKLVQVREYMKHCNDCRIKWELSNTER